MAKSIAIVLKYDHRIVNCKGFSYDVSPEVQAKILKLHDEYRLKGGHGETQIIFTSGGGIGPYVIKVKLGRKVYDLTEYEKW